MLVLDLCCANGHRFEAWFGSGADFRSQTERALVACPVCDDQSITRVPTAPHLNVSHLRDGAARGRPASESTEPASVPSGPGLKSSSLEARDEWQAKWHKAAALVLANTEDVGDRFAEEARRIHYGETAAQAIRGQATSAEVADLIDEGIEVQALPLPAALKRSLQ